MGNDPTTVDEYIAGAPEERRHALETLRAICRRCLPDLEERIEYGMPSYARDGTVELAFASQKSQIALYVLKKPVLDRYRNRFPASRMGKGCIRYPNPRTIDFELVERIVRESSESDAGIC